METVKGFQGVKLTCWDEDKYTANDFMGEAFLWFGDQILLDAVEFEFAATLQSRPKKNDKVSGFITIRSNVVQGNEEAKKESTSIIKKMLSNQTVNTVHEIAARAISRSDLVQVSATGKREIKIETSGTEKFVSFRELPSLNTKAKTKMIDSSISDTKLAFDAKLALWMVTCCNLAYKPENIVQSVCLYVWGMFEYNCK